MALPHADKLLERAQKGERLTSTERRHVLAYLMISDSTYTNIELGSIFQVTERQIRLDKAKIKQEKIKNLNEEDIGLVVADIAINLERQMKDLEASKKKARIGSLAYLKHCVAIQDAQLKVVKALQDLGYYPKNLGNMVVERFDFKAEVSKDGTVSTRPVDLKIEGEVTDAEFESVDTTRHPLGTPALSAPEVNT